MVPKDRTTTAEAENQYIADVMDIQGKNDSPIVEDECDTTCNFSFTPAECWQAEELSSVRGNTAGRGVYGLSVNAYTCINTLWQRHCTRNCLHCDQIVNSSDSGSQETTRYPKSSGRMLLSNDMSTSRGSVFRPVHNNNGEHYHREEHHINQKVVTIATDILIY